MTDRLATLAVALGALALFLLLFVHGEGGLEPKRYVPRPTTAEVRGNGYHAASLWLEASGLRSVSLRERIDTLSTRSDLAPAGNVLVVTLPGTQIYRVAEGRLLQQWISAGNTLIVLAALADNPDWSAVVGGVNVGDLNALSGLDFNKFSVDKQATAQASEPEAILPNRAHAYFAHVGSALAAFDPPQEDWSVGIPFGGFMLSLGHERDSFSGVLWTRLLGAGRIVVCGMGSLFTDKALARADNAQLFANMIGAHLGTRGAVIFDDFHQGLSAVYDPERFYRDPRLYLTGAILLALWFVWVLGATRLRLSVIRIAAPREADLVRAHGGFLARVLPRAVAAQRLLEHFLRRIRKIMPAQGASGDPWSYLQSSARVEPRDLAQLAQWHTQACAGERVPLVRLYNLILRIDRQLA